MNTSCLRLAALASDRERALVVVDRLLEVAPLAKRRAEIDVGELMVGLERERALEDLKRGRLQIVVTNDQTARGIELAGVTHIVNFDVPPTPEDYVQRTGRAGRPEAQGDAFTLMAPEEQRHLAAIERFVGRAIPRVMLPDFDYGVKPSQISHHAIYDDETARARRAAMRNAGYLTRTSPPTMTAAKAMRPAATGNSLRVTPCSLAPTCRCSPSMSPASVVALARCEHGAGRPHARFLVFGVAIARPDKMRGSRGHHQHGSSGNFHHAPLVETVAESDANRPRKHRGLPLIRVTVRFQPRSLRCLHP